MGKLKDALRKFGTKLTGKPTLDSNSYADIINDIADDYEGGGGGTTVVANPTLVGTEANLTSLQVGETKYKVPSGGGGSTPLYENNICFNGIAEDNQFYTNFKIYTTTPLTKATFLDYITNNFNVETINNLLCSGNYLRSIEEDVIVNGVMGIFRRANNVNFQLRLYEDDNVEIEDIETVAFENKVIQIF